MYELLKIDALNPMGSVFIPRHVVLAALERFNRKHHLELCRLDSPNDPLRDDPLQNEMIGKISDAGLLLEVIGRITEMWVDGNTLKCGGELQDSLFWPLPRKDHTPVLYMDFRHKSIADSKLPGCKRLITEATFTEVVLVYQAVTRLAVRKFRQKRQ